MPAFPQSHGSRQTGSIMILCGLLLQFWAVWCKLLQLDKNPGGHSLFWAIRVCAAEQDMVFRVLSLKQDLQIHH